ncbi:sigma-54-dependent Fis family transcriptional regulator [Hahella sp. CCB-MM4]|uniref:sigma-54-dependent transcriptional regulator n=1 Tax=Hahella sp. (strain CCB-MM4) TaxID=1926491 RepID=UPI000B9A1FDC|nr:sigma-54 dependent transcriptional regulator [Hahella sp. CCB-MM4]OZG71135.1 sigma-54-dependent Fis family transcriptional regulator [Hahella sp. CCB-MM4]
MSQPTVLIVDDESAFCELCAMWLTKAGYQVETCGDGASAEQIFNTKQIDLVLHDLALPPSFRPEDGIALLPHYKDRPVIVITGHDDKPLAMQAIEAGAWDFIGKPVDPELLLVVLERALIKRRLTQEVDRLRQEQSGSDDHLGLIGNSQAIADTRELIRRIAPTDVPVLIQGPSGTGKEVIANALHRHSLRRDGPFISVHCGAIPGELLESELFGYKRGAFTGADRDRKGLLAMAHQGTLFLDEIGEMPLNMQVKLLRVLQEGTYYPVGSREMETINFRLVSATNRVLPEAIESGLFRDDLYYRIKGLTLTTLPLKDRPSDIPVLIRHFLENLHHNDLPLSLDSEAMQWFCQQPWPGNVRELRNILESAAAICLGQTITLQEIQLITGQTTTPTTLLPSGDGTLEQQVSRLEIQLIEQALAQFQGNKTRTADHLGLTRQGLLKKIQRYGIGAQ